MTAVDRLVRRPGCWLAAGKETEIAVSSRVRLARNIENGSFPGWAPEAESVRLWNELSGVACQCRILEGATVVRMEDCDPVDRQVFWERHLISTGLAEKGKGSGVIFTEDERVSVMINEEDHLRLQVMGPGLDLAGLWKEADALDSEIEERVLYAFSSRLGYLTACPTNVGTGLRASVKLHLAGLRLINEIDPVIKGLAKLGLAVRGLFGEGTDTFGNMFQISNHVTLGETEEGIVGKLVQVVEEVIEHEKNARARLIRQKKDVVLDHVARAFAVLSHARILPSSEALDLLSALRMGVEMGLVRNMDVATLNELMLWTQPGHLQKIEGRVTESEERDRIRADVVRARVARSVELADLEIA